MVDLPKETHEALKLRAAQTGRSMKYLTDLILRYGLERLSVDALKAAPYVETRGRPVGTGNGMTSFERAVLGCWDVLLAEDAVTWRFSLPQVVKASGMYPSEALKGLRALERRGTLVRKAFEHALLKDDEGNPKMIDFWHRPSDEQKAIENLKKKYAERGLFTGRDEP